MPDLPLGRCLTHRATGLWRYRCFADPAYFLPWEEVPMALMADLKLRGMVPCDRNGVAGPWCANCRFGESEQLLPL